MSGSSQAHPVDRLPDLLLGELCDREAERMFDHMAGCPACASAWAELQAVSGALADAVPHDTPPPGARTNVMARVERDAGRRCTRGRWLPVAGALAGAAAASAVWLAVMRGSMPGQRVAALSGPHGMGGSVYMDTSLHRATVQVWRLPELPKGMVYEVWWNRGDTHMMGGTFGVDRHGDAFATLTIPDNWHSATSITVTQEPAPGTRQPTAGDMISGAIGHQTTTT